MQIYKLDEKVLSLKGNVLTFLKGIASNEWDKPLNAFLNLHGRIIATVRQSKISDDEFLISVPQIAVESLLNHLGRYAKLSAVKIETTPLMTYIHLGSREFLFSADEYVNSITEEEFTFYRLQHNLPLMGLDYQEGEFILNVHEYEYVSYTKGCFLGQEPVAKVHNRSKPSKKLVVVFQDECSPEQKALMTSSATDPQTQRRQGFLFLSTHS